MASATEADQTDPVVQTATDVSQLAEGGSGGRRMGKQRMSYSRETKLEVAWLFKYSYM